MNTTPDKPDTKAPGAPSNYEDMLYLPNHKSTRHPHMSIEDRAAQFSPFAALTGYDSAIAETARLTDRKIELDENSKMLLDTRLSLLDKLLKASEGSRDKPEISITYFESDLRKEGGSYVTIIGKIKKIDTFARQLILTDGSGIPIDDISELNGELFHTLEDTFA